jgi:hypothetical protein
VVEEGEPDLNYTLYYVTCSIRQHSSALLAADMLEKRDTPTSTTPSTTLTRVTERGEQHMRYRLTEENLLTTNTDKISDCDPTLIITNQ